MFARLLRSSIVAAVVGLSVIPAAAFADTSPAQAGKSDTHAVREGKNKDAFPMPAAAFKAKVEKRITKAREHMTEHFKKNNVAADKQKEILAKFDAGATKVRAAADKAGSDGTVTKEEAEQVRTLAKELRGKHGKKHEGQARRDTHDKKKTA